jgi:hypothetical protein
MARLVLQISKPTEGATVGKTIAVSGVAKIETFPEWPHVELKTVQVQFGAGGERKSATRSGTSWTCTGSSAAIGGSTLRITATASGTTTPKGGTRDDPEPGTPQPFSQSVFVEVTLEDDVLETLTIDPVTTPVTPDVLPYRLDLKGSAADVAGIKSVQVSLDDGEFEDAVKLTGTFSRWSKPLDLPAGQHRMIARAFDNRNNKKDASADISVREPFEPSDVDQVFQPTRYLLELLRFAERYVDVGDGATELTPALLTKRFHQPFDRLTKVRVFEEATRLLPQPRIAIEVLRRHLRPAAPPDLDQRFRGFTYSTILLNMGTTYDELRLARTADAATRQAIATRLGIGELSERPDRLDDITVSPESISDEQLDALFGYASTAPTDPLSRRAEAPDVMLWQRAALTAEWKRNDETHRDDPEDPQPIIEPDLIGEEHLRNNDPNDPAFSLWTARRTWITQKLADIQQEAEAVADPAARFDQLVTAHMGTIDVSALAARDAAGEDVGPDLLPFDLGTEAFRFLARSSAALANGLLLETEWQDVFSILLQVEKRRQYRTWRLEERQVSLVLQPSSFDLDPTPSVEAGRSAEIARWRAPRTLYTVWLQTLAARIAQAAALEARHQLALAATEDQVLPALRDALITEFARRQSKPEPLEAAAERLTRLLLIDLRNTSGQPTTRVEQAIETLQAVLFSARAGKLADDGAGQAWTIKIEATDEHDFDSEWEWIGTYTGWLAATRVFAYPENQLFPALYVTDVNLDVPTAAFRELIGKLRKMNRLTADSARQFASEYLAALRGDASVKLESELQKPFTVTDERADQDLVDLQSFNQGLTSVRQHHREIFWLVPMALAEKLQESRQFRPALDWYQTVYAYHLPPTNRRIFRGLQLEDGISSNYDRVPEWLIKELNPHVLATQRRNCYTRSTIMTIASCLLAYGDAEFSQNTPDANARARTLYEGAVDLLDLADARPETGPTIPFPANPVWTSLHEQGESTLSKIHRGLNIAGIATGIQQRDGSETTLPSHYRYAVLVERAKSLVAIAQQLEAAYLSALEQRDAQTYDQLQAGHDLEVVSASLAVQDLKLAEAQTGIRLAALQRERAQIQEDYFAQQLDRGLNGYEKAGLDALTAAVYLQLAAGSLSTAFAFDPLGGMSSAAQALSAFAGAASTGGQIAQTLAAYERREDEWKLQRSLAQKDVELGAEQVQLARNQLLLAGQERAVAGLQFEHAKAVAEFLATKFTNAELFEWMSGVLGRVYAYFLQQATALAQLAEAQLAFERQEPVSGFVSADYWRDTTRDGTPVAQNGGTDRRGLTGSARLLQDIYRLDEYAFETDRRKLHVAQTLSLVQLGAFELEQFRDTGVLTFATPQSLFDRDFPGHYLRLIKRVRISLIALIPPTRGVRATLSASGVSRVVVARGPFETVTMRREPESIVFTSAVNATGLFELEPEGAMLLPFEGMGVDTTWQLELPKAANPFDYRSIADVLLTLEYTALDDREYRQEVVRSLDSRFSGDRSFSLRNQFPDVWYELNNSQTVDDPQLRMRAALPLTSNDFPLHIDNLTVAHVTLFVVRKETLEGELSLPSLRHTTVDGEIAEAGSVRTVGGIVGTRRPAGAPWQVFVGTDPVGNWELQLEDDRELREWFTQGLIDDLVLIFTISGVSPPW